MRPFLSLPVLPLAVASALMLSACAGAQPTAYGPAFDGGYGYDQQLLESNRYRVTFTGNSQTPRQTVENYLLYRAAELTLETGNDYFVIVDRDVDRRTTYNTTGNGFGGLGLGLGCYRCGGPFSFGTSLGGSAYPIDSYQAYANIVVYKGEEPDDPDAYDAREVMENLTPM